jgi:hypothetical protein
MSLRSVTTLTADGQPIDVVIVTREAVEFENSSVTLDALNDDGESIKAAITMENGMQKSITLYEGYDYTPIADLTDEVIDARIVVLVRAMAE